MLCICVCDHVELPHVEQVKGTRLFAHLEKGARNGVRFHPSVVLVHETPLKIDSGVWVAMVDRTPHHQTQFECGLVHIDLDWKRFAWNENCESPSGNLVAMDMMPSSEM